MKNYIPLVLAVLLGLAAVLAVGRLLSERKKVQEEQATVVPLRCGPFRVFVYERFEEALRAAGLDRSGLVAALRLGVDVQRIEPAEGQVVGRIVGSIDDGRVRLVLAHEPDPPAPADWRLLGLNRGRRPAARVALPRLGGRLGAAGCAGAFSDSPSRTHAASER